MALPIQMNKMLPNGAALSWKYLCENIVDQIDVETKNLKMIGENSGTAMKVAAEQGNSQAEQIENQAKEMISEGAAGLSGAVLGLASELYSFKKANEVETEADDISKEDEITRAKLIKVDDTPPSSCGTTSLTGTIGKGTIAELPPNAEVELTASPNRGISTQNTAASARADVTAEDSESAELQVTNNRAIKQQATAAEEADDAVAVRDKAIADNKTKADILRNKANTYRQHGATISQMVNALGSSVGKLVSSHYKNLEAQDQQAATLAQGEASMLNSMLELNKDGLSAAESSLSGSRQIMDAAVQAAAAGYRG